MRRILKVGTALVVLSGLGFAGVRATETANANGVGLESGGQRPTTAAVATLVDGETFDVRFNDQLSRIRLLGVATPTPPARNQPGQCLGPEASAFLAQAIPVGAEVSLSYDEDRYGRPVAAATTSDGKLINAEIVRAGFGEAVPADGKTEGDAAAKRASIQAAAQEAATKGSGLHSADVPCTVPGQVKAVLDLVAKVPTSVPPGLRGVDLNNLANAASDARTAADKMVWAFAENRPELVWRVLDPAERTKLAQQVTQARDQVATAETALRAAANTALNVEATQGAAQAEADRIARQLAAIRAAEQRRIELAAKRAKAAQDAADAARRQAEDEKRRDDDKKNQEDKKNQNDDKKNDNSKKDDNKKDDNKNDSKKNDDKKDKKDK
jgi:micrococcal nuclease